MAYEACPNPREDCPYYDRRAPKKLRGTQSHGCFSDLDHVVPKRLIKQYRKTAIGKLVRDYINNPVNHEQLCRWDHDEKTANGDEPLPPVDEMKRALGRLPLEGCISEEDVL